MSPRERIARADHPGAAQQPSNNLQTAPSITAITLTGAEILGTAPQANGKRFRGMAPGSRKARGGFWLPCDRHRPALVILAESAVDAISARSLRIEGTREHGAVVASTAGITSSVPAWIEDWKPKRIVCAYDADSAGDRAAERLQISDPRVKRLRPHAAKDWNELLLQTR